MSGNRANASAIQRRTNGQQQQQATSVRGGGNQRSVAAQGRQMQQQQPQVRQNPKISVSDAIALTTLRLGRVESFINALPPLDQIGTSSGSGSGEGVSLNENMRVVDEAVFTSITTRLDNHETNHTMQKQTNQKFQANINVLSKTLEAIKKEIAELKRGYEDLKSQVLLDNGVLLEDVKEEDVAPANDPTIVSAPILSTATIQSSPSTSPSPSSVETIQIDSKKDLGVPLSPAKESTVRVSLNIEE